MTTSNFDGPPPTTGQRPTDEATDGDSKVEQAQQVAGNAKEQGGQVAATAKEEARNVAEEAKQQASGVLDQALSEVEEQSRTQRDRLVDTLRTFTDDVERMLSGEGGGNGLAADLARQVAERARGVTAGLQDREPSQILDEVRGFARRRPGTFLLGALAAGVVVGRLTRGAKDAGSSGQRGGQPGHAGSGVAAGTANGDPTAYPQTPVAPEGGTAAGSPISGVHAGSVAPPVTDPEPTPLAPDAGARPPAGDPYGGGSTL